MGSITNHTRSLGRIHSDRGHPTIGVSLPWSHCAPLSLIPSYCQKQRIKEGDFRKVFLPTTGFLTKLVASFVSAQCGAQEAPSIQEDELFFFHTINPSRQYVSFLYTSLLISIMLSCDNPIVLLKFQKI